MSYKNRDQRKKSVQPLKDILNEFIGSPRLSTGIYTSRVPSAWNQLMGPSVAKATKSVYYRNGVVFVTLHSSIIRSELMMYRDKIVSGLNNKIGSTIVKEIVLK